jgi:hypothetical protein
MSLASGENIVTIVQIEAETVFNFPYKYWEDTDLQVTIFNLDTSLETKLSYTGGDFTVQPVNGDEAAGAIITLATPVSNSNVIIERVVPYRSEADFKTGDGIPPDSLNSHLDQAAAQTQQLVELVGRQITAPISDPAGLNYTLAAVSLRANKAILFDNDGNIIVGSLVSSGDLIIDTTKGLDETANLVSVKIDTGIFEFNVAGGITLLDGGVELKKLETVADGKFIGRRQGGGAGTPIAYDILGDILEDDDFLNTNPTIHGATQANIKSYVANYNDVIREVRQHRSSRTTTRLPGAISLPQPNFTIDNVEKPQITQGMEACTGINFAPIVGTASRVIMIHAWVNWDCADVDRVMCLFESNNHGTDAIAVSYMEVDTNRNCHQTLTHFYVEPLGFPADDSPKAFTLRVGGGGNFGAEGTSLLCVNGRVDNVAVFNGGLSSGMEIIEYK